MISIDKNALENVYKTADEELIGAYIAGDKRYGWRNGLKKESDVEPGATATALIMNYFAFRGDASIERDIPKILGCLLNMQLEDGHGKKTGWEVMSLKSPDGERVPSVDVTAIVLEILQKNIHWLLSQGDDALEKEMQRAILEGGLWLYEQEDDGAWKIHERDMKRIFVTCNVLNALIPLMGHDKFMHSLQFLRDAQNSDGSWGKGKSNNDMGDIYHTAKVLNVLNTYFRIDARDNIKSGISYIKKAIESGLPVSPPWLEEEIHDCNGNAKSYYHDRYSELLLLMQRTPCHWTRYEYFKVLETFISLKANVNENQKFYETKTNQRMKKQIWLLVPAAKQSYEIVNRLFYDADKHICLSDNRKLLGFDLDEEEKNSLMDDEERRRREEAQRVAEEEAEKKKQRSIVLATGGMFVIVIILAVIRAVVWGMNNALPVWLDAGIGFILGICGTNVFRLLAKKYEWIGRFISK